MPISRQRAAAALATLIEHKAAIDGAITAPESYAGSKARVRSIVPEAQLKELMRLADHAAATPEAPPPALRPAA